MAVVAAAVGGIEAMARALAIELAPIRVNAIAPGYIDFGAHKLALLLESEQPTKMRNAQKFNFTEEFDAFDIIAKC